MAEEKKCNRRIYTEAEIEEALSLLHVLPMTKVSEKLGIPKTTISRWYDKMKKGETVHPTPQKGQGKGETVSEQNAHTIAEARASKVDEFINKSWGLAETTLEQLNCRVKRAKDTLDEIDELKNFILNNRDKVLSGEDRDRYSNGAIVELLRKLEKMEVIKINELATVFGVAYDKFALASGKATARVQVGFEDYAE